MAGNQLPTTQKSKKKKKFRLFKTPRYLPGSVQRNVLVQDLAEYNKHRYKVFTVEKKVDDNPPQLDIGMQVNRTILSEDCQRMVQIAKENRELSIKINKINKRKGKIDSYNPHAYDNATHWRKHYIEMRLIEKHNKEIYRRLSKARSSYAHDDLEKEWQCTIEKLRHSCKYPLVVLDKKPGLDLLVKREPSISCGLEKMGDRYYAFIDFLLAKYDIYLGRIIVELYHDFTPVTVQNFLSLCKGENGLTYEKCQIHNIARDKFIETGDITLGNGKGGMSIYGEKFDEENHILKHSRIGVLSMIRKPGKQNDSQFSITLSKMESLDGKRVVFGEVIKGNHVLVKIAELGRKVGKPPVPIIINKCGEFNI